MPVVLLVAAVFFLLHQDVWFWNDVRPLVFGFLPVGLFYHAVYTVAIAVAMVWATRAHWPAHLEDENDTTQPK